MTGNRSEPNNRTNTNMPVGYPDDEDDRDEPEWECVRCGGVVVSVTKDEHKCLDCEMTYEQDGDPT